MSKQNIHILTLFSAFMLALVGFAAQWIPVSTKTSALLKIYWVDADINRILRANSDGTGKEELITSGLPGPIGIAADTVGGKIYWVDNSVNQIQYANLDGSDVKPLIFSGLRNPLDITLDTIENKIYWVEGAPSRKIRRADLDGTGVETLVTIGSQPSSLALDLVRGKIYWVDWIASRLYRANLDGTAVEGLITTGITGPNSIAVDSVGEKIYWTDWHADKIQRSNLDGTSIEDLVTGLATPDGIALDVANGKMYWADRDTGKIQRANLNGTGVEDLVTGLPDPASIALVPDSRDNPTETPKATPGATTVDPPTSTPTPRKIGTPVVPPTSTPTETPAHSPDLYEEDDLCLQGSSISPDGSIQHHTFHPGEKADVDWVRFESEKDIEYLIEAHVPPTSKADVVLEVYAECASIPTGGQDYAFSPDVRLKFRAPKTGSLFLKLTNHDPEEAGDEFRYDLSVRSLRNTSSPGALILVAGSIHSDDLVQPNIYHVTDTVYQLFKNNGYTDERIFYLAPDRSHRPDVDALATVGNLKAAITEWAVDKVGTDRALTIYIMDHGSREFVYLDKQRGEWVTPAQLDQWLHEVEEAHLGLNVNVIIEACYAGSFISEPKSISKPERVIITSSNDDGLAWASEDGAHFSDHFLDALGRGESLYTSFRGAQIAAQMANPNQSPWLDGDGDGNADADGSHTVAAQRGFAFAGTFPDDVWPPYIVQVEPIVVKNGRGRLRIEVRDDVQVDDVWAVIYGPDYTPPVESDALIQDTLPTAKLLDQGNNWYGAFYDGFNQSGIYRIVLHAEDNQGSLARPMVIEIKVGGQNGHHIFLPIVSQ
ncbi:SMP-30/gluconolactonase/LRE family protein [Chloroflexi bacterium TSY]|nr:SMP-30/gluconolactonase/LRE family protein [Chloroflexi bacterium TSY]